MLSSRTGIEADQPAIFSVIERDINRCFPSTLYFTTAHIIFSDPKGDGQKNLRNVLRCYALFNPELGYCQGMGMLVGVLLMRMIPVVKIYLNVGCLLGTSGVDGPIRKGIPYSRFISIASRRTGF